MNGCHTMTTQQHESEIQKRYESLMSNYRLAELDELMESTRIQPHKNLVKQAYTEYLRTHCIGSFIKLSEVTGIEPVGIFFNSQLHSTLEKNGMVAELKGLVELTRGKPLLCEEQVQEGYKEYLEEGELAKFKILFELTRLKPSEQTVQGAYLKYKLQGKSHEFQELENITSIKPEI